MTLTNLLILLCSFCSRFQGVIIWPKPLIVNEKKFLNKLKDLQHDVEPPANLLILYSEKFSNTVNDLQYTVTVYANLLILLCSYRELV